MTPAEIEEQLVRARELGCAEALFCLGDKPEKAFSAYRRTLASLGQTSTVEYLHWAGKKALAHGLLPHTNAGLLTDDDMTRLKEVNVSLGLMLECVSPRLCEPGMPHHRAPDKRPDRRLAMIDAARATARSRSRRASSSASARRAASGSRACSRSANAHRKHGHIQEVIVQNFRAVAGRADGAARRSPTTTR